MSNFRCLPTATPTSLQNAADWPPSVSVIPCKCGWVSRWVWSDQCCAREISQSLESGLSSSPGQHIWVRHAANGTLSVSRYHCQRKGWGAFHQHQRQFPWGYTHMHTRKQEQHAGSTSSQHCVYFSELQPRAGTTIVFPTEWTHLW